MVLNLNGQFLNISTTYYYRDSGIAYKANTVRNAAKGKLLTLQKISQNVKQEM